MEIDGITVGKIAAEMSDRAAEIGNDGELMARGARCVLALSEKLAVALSTDLPGLDLKAGFISRTEALAEHEREVGIAKKCR